MLLAALTVFDAAPWLEGDIVHDELRHRRMSPEESLGIAAVPLTTVLRDPCFQKRYTLLTHNIGGEIALSWRRRQFMGAAGRRFIQCTTAYFDSLETENAELIRALAADGENDV